MSAAIGGRSEGIGAAPDRSAAQTTSKVKSQEQRFQKEFQKLTPEEQELVISGGKFDKFPFGAELGNLFARKNFRQGLANKFLGAPSGANVDRKQAAARVVQLDQAIAEAKKANAQNNADRATLEQQGLNIFAGSPLDIAFSNKTRQFNNIIAQAEAEKKGIGLQTDTKVRKSLFQNFKVVTDKRNGKGRLRGVFDPSGRQGLSVAQTEAIKKQDFLVADEATAIANRDLIAKASAGKSGRGSLDGNAARRAGRSQRAQDAVGQADLQSRLDNREDKEFFTDQLLSQRSTKASNRQFNQNVADANAERIAELDSKIAPLDAGFREGFVSILGRPVPFQNRTSSNKKSGTNSRGISDKERDQFFEAKGRQRQDLKNQKKALTTIANRDIVKVENNPDINRPRQASLFEALGTLNRVLGLPQFNGDRGSNTTLKAQVGALNKVQNQRISEQKKETSRRDTKINFEKQLNAINANGELNQKQKKAAIFKAARERDEALKGKIVTNTQFEQSRAGFAASRTNIVSGHTVRSVQDFIDLGRKKRRIGRK